MIEEEGKGVQEREMGKQQRRNRRETFSLALFLLH
jgi:hypothetical protein